MRPSERRSVAPLPRILDTGTIQVPVSLRRFVFPLRLVGARLRAGGERALLIALGVAAGAAVLAAVLGGRLVMQDRALAARDRAAPARRPRGPGQLERCRRQLPATEPRGRAPATQGDRRRSGRRNAVPRIVDPGAPGQPARRRRPRPLRAPDLGPAAGELRACTLRGPAARGRRADPVHAGAASGRGRARRAEAGCADRPVRVARTADGDDRAGSSLPHAPTVAGRDRQRNRRALSHDGARDLLPLVCLVRSGAKRRHPPLVGRRLLGARPTHLGATGGEPGRVRRHCSHGDADGGQGLLDRRLATPACASDQA